MKHSKHFTAMLQNRCRWLTAWAFAEVQVGLRYSDDCLEHDGLLHGKLEERASERFIVPVN